MLCEYIFVLQYICPYAGINSALCTSEDLKAILLERTRREYNMHIIHKVWKRLGWVRTKARYCQLIRLENCIKRLVYAKKLLVDIKQFRDMIFTDESTIELENSTRLQFRRVCDFHVHIRWHRMWNLYTTLFPNPSIQPNCMFGQVFLVEGQPKSIYLMDLCARNSIQKRFCRTCSKSSYKKTIQITTFLGRTTTRNIQAMGPKTSWKQTGSTGAKLWQNLLTSTQLRSFGTRWNTSCERMSSQTTSGKWKWHWRSVESAATWGKLSLKSSVVVDKQLGFEFSHCQNSSFQSLGFEQLFQRVKTDKIQN